MHLYADKKIEGVDTHFTISPIGGTSEWVYEVKEFQKTNWVNVTYKICPTLGEALGLLKKQYEVIAFKPSH